MSEALIRQAFETTLKTWADSQNIPIAFENVAFTASARAYLRSYLLPGTTTSDTLDRLHRHYIGVYQVSICMPLGTGPGDGDALTASVVALFPPAVPIVASGLTVYVMQPMSASQGRPDGDHFVIPLSCPYRADA